MQISIPDNLSKIIQESANSIGLPPETLILEQLKLNFLQASSEDEIKTLENLSDEALLAIIIKPLAYTELEELNSLIKNSSKRRLPQKELQRLNYLTEKYQRHITRTNIAFALLANRIHTISQSTQLLDKLIALEKIIESLRFSTKRRRLFIPMEFIIFSIYICGILIGLIYFIIK